MCSIRTRFYIDTELAILLCTDYILLLTSTSSSLDLLSVQSMP